MNLVLDDFVCAVLNKTGMSKIFRVYFENNRPLFAEFYSNKELDVYPIGIFGQRMFNDCVYDFLLVEAENEDEALRESKEYTENDL